MINRSLDKRKLTWRLNAWMPALLSKIMLLQLLFTLCAVASIAIQSLSLWGMDFISALSMCVTAVVLSNPELTFQALKAWSIALRRRAQTIRESITSTSACLSYYLMRVLFLMISFCRSRSYYSKVATASFQRTQFERYSDL